MGGERRRWWRGKCSFHSEIYHLPDGKAGTGRRRGEGSLKSRGCDVDIKKNDVIVLLFMTILRGVGIKGETTIVSIDHIVVSL